PRHHCSSGVSWTLTLAHGWPTTTTWNRGRQTCMCAASRQRVTGSTSRFPKRSTPSYWRSWEKTRDDAPSLADAELGENAVEQVGGGRLAGDLAQCFERGPQVDGDKVER